MAARLFSTALWKRVNDHFRTSGAFYVEAPRPRRYAKKQRLMFKHFPDQLDVPTQAAYLAKNLVNLQRFPDANKRTASVLLEVFLEENGYELACANAAYADFLLDVQRRVPPSAWEGRTFSLTPEYIPWREDDYHQSIRAWFAAHANRKA